jgi:asparagine synthase (glutamine-hydrolysing)
MCGITGFWLNKPHHFDSDEVLEGMMAAINHRGPDSSGSYINNEDNISFGHVRLSILDLTSAGHQPMQSSSKRYVLTYNGEIYNHKEIRKTIESCVNTKNWVGTSDTETLLAAIECWGLNKAILKCRGMFAFALWDMQKKKLFFARDRFGEKPLYFLKDKKKIVFASEIKAIRKFSDEKLQIDNSALRGYFETSYVGESNSIYSSVHKVQPGNIVEFSSFLDEPKIYPFWSLEQERDNHAFMSSNQPIQKNIKYIDELLKEVISSQMISDVPLGSFLSGGIDSSLVTAIMQKISSNKVNSFSIGFEEDEYNEAVFAEEVASYLGTEHQSFYLNQSEALNVIPQLARIYDEPFADYSQIPTLLLSREAKKYVTVALTGDGGDEVFGGYNRYIFAPRIWKFASKFPAPIRKQIKFLGKAAHYFGNNQNNFMQSIVKGSGLPKSSLDRFQHLADILGSASDFEDLFLKLTRTFQTNTQVLVNHLDKSEYINNSNIFRSDFSLSRSMMFADTQAYLPSDILVKVDRASMSTALETRAPFLDHKLVEAAWKLPDQQLFNKKTGKFILRELLSTYLPKKLFERPKQGFTIPIDKWLRNDLKDWAEDLLSPSKLKFYGFLDENAVISIWNEHQTEQYNHGHKLWTILMFQLWLEEWSN